MKEKVLRILGVNKFKMNDVVSRVIALVILTSRLSHCVRSPCRRELTSSLTPIDICYISSDVDLLSIRHNVTLLRVAFSLDNTVTWSNASLPRLDNIRRLEMDVSHVPRLHASFFSNVSRVVELELYHAFHSTTDYMVDLDPRVFTSLKALKSLHLPDLGISELPEKFIDGLHNLEYIDLNQNRIQGATVFTAPYDCCQKLTALNLAQNNISDVVNIPLCNLRNLRSLDLHGNKITVLRRAVFLQLSGLLDINLSGNGMIQIESQAFTGLERLNTLYLDNNALSGLTINTFNGLSNLKLLDLGSNALQVISGNTFSSLKLLETLILNGNDLFSLEPRAFHGLSSLKILQLTNNRLSGIAGNSFSDLQMLRTLNLQHNVIASIDVDLLSGLSSLIHLGLANNSLRTLPSSLFDESPELRSIDLSSNPWNCDCSLHWLVTWIRSHDVTIDNLDSTFCTDTSGARGSVIITEAFDVTSCATDHGDVNTADVITTTRMCGADSECGTVLQDGLTVNQQIVIILAACVFALLIVALAGLVAHKVFNRCGSWNRPNKCADCKSPTAIIVTSSMLTYDFSSTRQEESFNTDSNVCDNSGDSLMSSSSV